jgi:hypothetical protein
MRLAATLGVLVLAFAAAACTTTAVSQAGGAACDGERLAPIQASLRQASSQDAYYEALRRAYPSLVVAYDEATDAAAATAEPRAKIACHTVAAEAAMIQSYLPARERAGMITALEQPPAQAAAGAARQAEALCATSDDPRRCAFARIVAAAALSLDAGSRLSDAAANPTSTATVAGWRAAETQMNTLRQGADEWPAVLAQAEPALSSDLARS